LLRDLLAIDEGASRLRGVAERWWQLKRQSGSHRTLSRAGYADFVFAFHDGEEIGPRMLARIAKHTGITPNDV
jgi:predicted RNA binding protein YcfA (HicA-like mRNA interferase family)